MFTSQSRLNFDAKHLLRMGVRQAYVTPFETNSEGLMEPEGILRNLDLLKEKADAARPLGLEVYPFFVTINHPEGNFVLPSRYRMQRNVDGSPRPDFICFRDRVRQEEMLTFARRCAELGFARIAFDDDLRDAFCYCDVHLEGFEPFRGRSRAEVAQILNDVSSAEHEEVRSQWYACKREGMEDYARRLEGAIHQINPGCRIGICTSAKRCHDFSGRGVWAWASLFDTPRAPVFVRLCGECYHDSLMSLAQATGWHQYMDSLYPSEVERLLEITSVTTIGYRSPGTVCFEIESVLATTGPQPVHLCWTEDFPNSGLDEALVRERKRIETLASQVPGRTTAPLVLYCGEELGPYTPILGTSTYGMALDPIMGYNTTALCGLPIVPRAEIPKGLPAVLACGIVSRQMTREIDSYVASGGVAVLDAPAAKGYRAYGGSLKFNVEGPVSGHRHELGQQGQRSDLIADFNRSAVYHVVSETGDAFCEGYDLSGTRLGTTVAALRPEGRGALVVLGYDLSALGAALVQVRWRERLVALFESLGVEIPVRWAGPPAVQVVLFEDAPGTVALLNYNTHAVEGDLLVHGRAYWHSLAPLSVMIVE